MPVVFAAAIWIVAVFQPIAALVFESEKEYVPIDGPPQVMFIDAVGLVAVQPERPKRSGFAEYANVST